MPVCVYRPWCTLRAVQPPKTRTPSLQRRCLLRYESQVLLVRLCPRQHVQQDGRILVRYMMQQLHKSVLLTEMRKPLSDMYHRKGKLQEPGLPQGDCDDHHTDGNSKMMTPSSAVAALISDQGPMVQL